jgi:hypothetical protein
MNKHCTLQVFNRKAKNPFEGSSISGFKSKEKEKRERNHEGFGKEEEQKQICSLDIFFSEHCLLFVLGEMLHESARNSWALSQIALAYVL